MRNIFFGFRNTASYSKTVAPSLAAILFFGLVPPPIRAAPCPAGSDSAPENSPLWGDDRLVDPMSEKGQAARGLYFNGPLARRLGAEGMIRAVKQARMNAAVVNLKDEEGRVFYDTRVDVLQEQKQRGYGDTAGAVQAMREAGIYLIGRIVCFSDPVLPRNHHDLAVLDVRPQRAGRIWADTGRRNPWLDPYNRKNHDMFVQMVREGEALGLSEIQLDYFRFPVDESTVHAMFPAQVETPRRQVLLELLRRMDQAIEIPIGIDVFGLAAFRDGDPAGLGQSLNDWALHAEVFSPMLYLNAMSAWLRNQKKNRAGTLVEAGVRRLRQRLGYGPVIRPFLQAFPQGADYYNAEFIAEQILGARNGGADGFLFWHPGSKFRLVRDTMNLGRVETARFDLDERIAWRRQAWGDNMSPAARAVFFAEPR